MPSASDARRAARHRLQAIRAWLSSTAGAVEALRTTIGLGRIRALPAEVDDDHAVAARIADRRRSVCRLGGPAVDGLDGRRRGRLSVPERPAPFRARSSLGGLALTAAALGLAVGEDLAEVAADASALDLLLISLAKPLLGRG